MSHAATEAGRPVPKAALLLVFFASGAAALIYEVLWLKELGRLFGVTAYAAATTLAVFFAGLALGGLFWGRRAASMASPMRVYAYLEIGIAASALLYFLLFDAYTWLQEPLFGAIGYRPWLLLLTKFLLATAALLLPSFLMGGTLPVLAQFLVRSRSELGARATLLYAFNTIGAAAGALAAGFFLPRMLGFQASYLAAIAINLAIAATAWRWRDRSAWRSSPGPELDPVVTAGSDVPRADEALSRGTIALVAALSGLATLGMEVVWTRMYAQVLQNSVYTFAIILTVFLASLALGAGLAHGLCRWVRSPRLALAGLLTGSGILVAASPWLFQLMAGRLDYMSSSLGFGSYVAAVFAGTFLVIGPAVVVMGAVFPYLMKLSEGHARSAGRTVGRLAAINTAAAIAGSLLFGFFLLGWLGVPGCVRGTAVAYIGLAMVVWPARQRALRPGLAIPALTGLLLLLGPFTTDYSSIWLDESAGEELVEGWEGPAGSVSVVRHQNEEGTQRPGNSARGSAGGLRLRVNSSYNLGSSASAVNERLQGQLPLAMHPEPGSAFFLGLGTGITASGALDFPLDRLLVCEVNPDVVTASRKHFGPWLAGLFEDPRVTVLPEDGRTWLAATRERFDVIVADIFLTFKAGVGSLYTREHFRAVREHLREGGLFVQWLPMFDLSEAEMAIIVKTMQAEFPSVTLWRRSLSPRYPVYALVGRLDSEPLDPAVLRSGLARLRESAGLPEETWLLNIPFAAYAGNLTALSGLFADAPVNTDDWTLLEYLAPVTERDSRGSGQTPTLAWEALLAFSERLLAELPPDRDPHLTRLSPAERRQVHAGVAYYGHVVSRAAGQQTRAAAYLAEYRRWLGLGPE